MLDRLLTTDPAQRVRLEQAGLALLLLAVGVLAMQGFVIAGIAPARPVAWWTGVTLAGMVGFFALIRSGASARFGDPSLTVPQMVFALTSGAVAYALLGAGRGGVFPIVMVVLMFGLFAATPRQMRHVAIYAVAIFGATMALMTALRPTVYPWRVELGHFLMVATMMPAMSILAARLARLRERSRERREELAAALARIRELATRDEATGLVNRRHMQELMAQEHQRGIRSGRTFCVAVLEVAMPPEANAGAAESRWRAVAEAAQATLRVADTLARWQGGTFVLLMSDTRAALARTGLERLHEALAALDGGAPPVVEASTGLAEHRAGESVDDTFARADAAHREALAAGGRQIVVAA
jgi:diguanylate cyclase (GGDEF)-like protein